MSMTGGSGARIQMPQLQTDALLNQAAAVQNTWYTVLDTTKNVKIMFVLFRCTAVNETVQLRFTIDGLTRTLEQACVANTYYYARWGADATTGANWYASLTVTADMNLMNPIEGRSIKIEMRKTTATGASALQCRVPYSIIP